MHYLCAYSAGEAPGAGMSASTQPGEALSLWFWRLQVGPCVSNAGDKSCTLRYAVNWVGLLLACFSVSFWSSAYGDINQSPSSDFDPGICSRRLVHIRSLPWTLQAPGPVFVPWFSYFLGSEHLCLFFPIHSWPLCRHRCLSGPCCSFCSSQWWPQNIYSNQNRWYTYTHTHMHLHIHVMYIHERLSETYIFISYLSNKPGSNLRSRPFLRH